MLGLGLNSETETEDIYSGDGEGARLYELISTVAARGLDYDIIESSYDEKTGRAFVKIKAFSPYSGVQTSSQSHTYLLPLQSVTRQQAAVLSHRAPHLNLYTDKNLLDYD